MQELSSVYEATYLNLGDIRRLPFLELLDDNPADQRIVIDYDDFKPLFNFTCRKILVI
ncbi:hypothetical protein D3C75_994310 [compost metagenome]